MSRIANPVPPVVIMRLRFWAVHWVIWDWIAEIESGTMEREATVQVSGDSRKVLVRIEPERSVEGSWDAVSLT
jgi:hypothetical protein